MTTMLTTATRPKRRTVALSCGVALAVLTLAAGCGDDAKTTTAATTTAPAAASVEVSDIWARTSASMQTNGAAYMEIHGGTTDDSLIGASVPAEISAVTEMHETVMASGSDTSDTSGMGMDQSTTMGESTDTTAGMMEMRQVSSILVPAGETVMLEPGGYHIMLIDLVKPLVVGETFELTLTFEKAGTITVPVEVRS